LTVSGPDTANRVLPRARRTVAGKNGGVLVPFSKDYQPPPGSNRPPSLTETLRLAREAAPSAVRTLIDALSCDDPRVRVTAAALLLDRGFGRVPEARAEVPNEAQIDLSQLKDAELQILLGLVQSGRLKGVASPTEIDGDASD
jgi:hypothetical protein